MDTTARFSLSDATAILTATPNTIAALLRPLPEALLHVREADHTWTPLQVLAHLAWGEVDDWIPRIERLLEHGTSQAFAPFDREAGFARYQGWGRARLLDEFTQLRERSLMALHRRELTTEHLGRQGRHPQFGPVTLEQLLATWATHDLAHVTQIARILTRHQGQFVGPWREYFSVLAS
jgi:hypothetical protein